MLLHALLLIALTGLGAFAGSVAARRCSLKVQDLKRLRLEPGDKVVLRLAAGLDASSGAIDGIEEQLRTIFPDNQVIVLADDHDFTVVRRESSRGPRAAVMKRGGISPRVKGDAPTTNPGKLTS